MTLDDLCASCSAKSGMDNTAASTERLLMEAWAKEGVRQVLMRTHVAVTTTTIPLVAGTADYTLAATTLQVIASTSTVGSGGLTPRVKVISEEELLDLRQGGQNVGLSRYAALLGHDKLGVYPTPDASGTLALYIVSDPTGSAWTGSAEALTYASIPTWAQRAIEYWMLVQASQRNRDFKAAAYYEQQFLADVRETRRRARGKLARTLTPARLGGRSRSGPYRNDIY